MPLWGNMKIYKMVIKKAEGKTETRALILVGMMWINAVMEG